VTPDSGHSPDPEAAAHLEEEVDVILTPPTAGWAAISTAVVGAAIEPESTVGSRKHGGLHKLPGSASVSV
jgi:hypothetical protein